MKPLFFFIGILLTSSFIQPIPKGRYFKNMHNTVWYSTDVLDQGQFDLEREFHLLLAQEEIPSNHHGVLWSFDSTLTIESIAEDTYNKTLLLNCNFVNNETDKTLTLFLEQETLQFSYVSNSTGSSVYFKLIE